MHEVIMTNNNDTECECNEMVDELIAKHRTLISYCMNVYLLSSYTPPTIMMTQYLMFPRITTCVLHKRVLRIYSRKINFIDTEFLSFSSAQILLAFTDRFFFNIYIHLYGDMQ